MSDIIQLPQSDKDFLELLMFKIEQKAHWASQWFSFKQPSDERRYKQASKELSNLVKFLKRQGYDYKRFHALTTTQNELFK